MKYLLSFILLVLSFGISAQNEWGLHAGLDGTLLQDRGVSPLVQSGRFTTANFSWRRLRPNNHWQADIEARIGNNGPAAFPGAMASFASEDIHGNVEKANIPLRGPVYGVHLSFRYARRLGDPEAAGRWEIGAGFCNNLWYSESFANESISNFGTFSPQVGWVFAPAESRGRLSLSLACAVVGAVSRMPYSGSVSQPETRKVEAFFKSGSDWRWLGEIWQPQWNMDYTYRLGKHWSIGGKYHFTYTYAKDPRPLRILQQGLQLGIYLH